MPGPSKARNNYLKATRGSKDPRTPYKPNLAYNNYQNMSRDIPSYAAPAVAAPASDPYAGYVAAYKDSLAKSRANVEEQFRIGLEDATNRERLSQGVTATLPGRISAIYDQANPQIQQAAEASKAAQASTGLQSFTPAGAGTEPIQAAMTSAAASRQADVPLIAAGVTSAANQRRGALSQAKLEAMNDVNQQESQYGLEMARMTADRQAEADNAARDRAWQIEDQQRQYREDARARRDERRGNRSDAKWQLRQQAAADRQAQNEANRLQLQSFLPNNTSADRGQALLMTTPKAARSIMSSSAFKKAQQTVARHGMQAALKELAGRPRAQALLKATYSGQRGSPTPGVPGRLAQVAGPGWEENSLLRNNVVTSGWRIAGDFFG